MTVKELKEALAAYPEDAEVRIQDSHEGDVEISRVTIGYEFCNEKTKQYVVIDSIIE